MGPASGSAAGASNALLMACRSGGRLALAGVALVALTYSAVWWMQGCQYGAHRSSRAVAPPVDAVIVLGGGMDPDGELNIIGRARVQSALALLQRGEAANAIFTGFGCAGAEDGCSEAAAMRARAEASGADPDRLIVEPDARTTLENLVLSFAIAEERGFRRLAVLTDAFHLTRAVALARLLGREVVPVAAEGGLYSLPAAEQFPVLMRETMAWWYNLGKAAAWQGLGLLGWTEAERGQVIR
jgi:uncharacterized SAM-binding protein YcdF (DUF218 family)